MNERVEDIPFPDNNEPFPVGDISKMKETAGLSHLRYLRTISPSKIHDILSKQYTEEVGYWFNIPGQQSIWRDMGALATDWGRTVLPEDTQRGKQRALWGMGFSVTLMRKSGILPVIFKADSEDMWSLGGKNDQEIDTFSANAWRGMQVSHGRLHNIMNDYADFVAAVFRFEDDDDGMMLFDAGMAVPYLLANQTLLKKRTKESFARNKPKVLNEAEREAIRKKLAESKESS